MFFFVDFWEREWECMKRLWCYNGCDGCVGMRMWDPAPCPVWLSDSLETWGVTAQWKQEKPSLNTVDNEVKKRKKTSVPIHLVTGQLLFPPNKPAVSLSWHMRFITNNGELPASSPGAARSPITLRWLVWIKGLVRDRRGWGGGFSQHS